MIVSVLPPMILIVIKIIMFMKLENNNSLVSIGIWTKRTWNIIIL